MSEIGCSNCGQALQVLHLAGHYASQVELELCGPCHLLWFDSIEAARLSGPGLLALIGEMAQAQRMPHQSLNASLACLSCRRPVKLVHNQTRWGRSQQFECPERHGAWQSFAQFLQERGLLRPLSLADRHRLQALPQGLHCVNCGGSIGAEDSTCSWCKSVPSLLDVARLAQALDPEGATAGHQVHGTAAQHQALNCMACGSATKSPQAWQCTACGATLATPSLASAHDQVSALGPALQDHARKPAPHVVKERMRAQIAAQERQRQRAAQMQKEADARSGGAQPSWPWPEGRSGTDPVSEKLQEVGAAALRNFKDRVPLWLQAVMVGLAVMLGLWWWG